MLNEPNPTQHVSFTTCNTRIFFPFEPYETQRQYAQSVIESLSNRQNAILESPTGTGKTLSLLCSTLAWLQSQGGIKTTVFYTSRTHLQLSQAAKELKRSAYSRTPSVVIGSRAQMCLNDDVKTHGGDHLINRACRNAITKNACTFFNNYEQKLESLDVDKVNDIEDLIEHGRSRQICPYYASKKIAESKATVIFMPYNYLIDPTLKKSEQLKLENSIVIFDEAHNIESVLKDAVSGSFSQTCLKTIQDSCYKLPSKLSDALTQDKLGFNRQGSQSKKPVEENSKKKRKKDKEEKVNPIEELASKLTTENLSMVSRCAELLMKETISSMIVDNLLSVERVLHVMKTSGINYSTSNVIISTLDSMSSFWSIAGVMSPTTVARYVSSISNLSHFISLLYPEGCLSVTSQREHEKKLDTFYMAFLEGQYEQSAVLKRGQLKDWTLNLWCLHPAIGIKRIISDYSIRGPRSMIVTSGTLAPLHTIEKELEVSFPIKREFKHIITNKQLKIMLLSESPNGYTLKSNFEESRKDEYKMALGKTLMPILKVLPFGTLVFFPSYRIMEKTIKFWKDNSTIWRDMNSSSALFIETKSQDIFKNDVSAYKRKIAQKGRAVFFGVCRGKLSEGVNFEANQCRTVIMTGLPFPSSTDPRVQATRKFHEKRGDPRGDFWYSREMTRALNQTIGRVIRSRTDFGMLLLCDPRFLQYRYSLSEWTREFFPNKPSQIGSVDGEIKEFFIQHGIDIRESVSESVGAFEIEFSGPRRSSVQTQNSTVDRSKSSSKSDNKSTQARSNSSTSSQISQSQNRTNQSLNYSILNEAKSSNRPTSYKCYICKNAAQKPMRTHCPCASVGCTDCLKHLNNKTCGGCKTTLKFRDFKELRFFSASKLMERYRANLKLN